MELIHEALEGITHSDSRLWVTLQYLLFVPGKLTREFIAGRRVSYLPPFRLYLVMSIAFFLLTAITQTEFITFDTDAVATAANCRDLDIKVFGSHAPQARMRRACAQIVSDHGKNFQHIVIATIPKAMFIFLPLIAFFHMLLYWRPRHFYAEHLLFFIHLHSYAFLTMSILLLLGALGDAFKSVGSATAVAMASIGVYIPVYLLLAMRRVFSRRWINTVFKACVLFLIYVTVLAFTMVGVLMYAIWQI